jgi:signal transduction histidine kinase
LLETKEIVFAASEESGGKVPFSVFPSDLHSFRRQQTAFIVLNLLLFSVLLFLHTVFESYWGHPPAALIVALSIAFVLKSLELTWLRRLNSSPKPNAIRLLTWASVALNLGLAILLITLTDHDDTPYSVLLVVPILEVAFRFSLLPVVGVIAAADFLNFFGLWLYYHRHSPSQLGEYLEAAISSLILSIVGLLVWFLVKHLSEKEQSLAQNLLELERTRQKLLHEEKLAAVGRLSSAIAHEIRNPVAMISSSLATAKQLDGQEREEMFEIATEEATRLVTLTTDFLAYARPRPARLALNSVNDTVAYVADVCRAHASHKQVDLRDESAESVAALTDPGQLEQALINLVMNAVDAAPSGSTVMLRVLNHDPCKARIDVENSGDPILPTALDRIFEPFFTTKDHGTGLGLPIARNIARLHGGDLILSENRPGCVRFSLLIPRPQGERR